MAKTATKKAVAEKATKTKAAVKKTTKTAPKKVCASGAVCKA